ncbi:MAG: SDR family NAD(P)-dependent oxidoreductase [Chloroflexi bacterium]|nr:MAG: SDR family NAD(P)-dependent oxidoreductase [Chloroflexota bacterium]
MAQPDMRGKVCLVTGSSSGLGRATAHGLAKLGATVILGCRDRQRGELTQAEIRTASGNESVDLLLVDLSVLASVRAMAAEFEKRYARLDVLINNAAVFKSSRTVTVDGLETMFATNHLGSFLLTNLLLERLKTSAPSRILTITAPSTTTLNFDDLQGEKKFSAFEAFGASKACNLLFTYELARQLKVTGVSANAIYPGLVKSSLMREAAAPVRWFTSLISTTPEKAAETVVYYASSPEIEDKTGLFFKGRQVIESSPSTKDEAVQRRLWDVSVGLAKLE